MMRRYITAAKAEELRRSPVAMFTPTGAQTFNMVTMESTDWYIVPDDDPRVDTIVEILEPAAGA